MCMASYLNLVINQWGVLKRNCCTYNLSLNRKPKTSCVVRSLVPMPGNYQKGGTPKLYITWTDFIMYVYLTHVIPFATPLQSLHHHVINTL
jgi:hypothetical protein